MIKKTPILLLTLLCGIFLSDITYGQPRNLNRRSENTRQAGQQKPARRFQVAREPVTLNESEITLAIGETIGSIKPLLGVNAGPVPSGEPNNADVTAAYRNCGVTLVRTHDFYGPLDLSVSYPDINADPANPASYDFSAGDKVFAAIINAGFEPYIRLGDSYNNARIPANGQQRKNLEQAGCEFIRHYRSGANNGFTSNFRYVEIWNEPDNKQFWPGNYKDFFPYFAQTFAALKQQFPDLKVGGPGFVVASYKIPQARENVRTFLAYLKERNLKPDFISFHIYSNDPGEYYDEVLFYRREAQNAGFADCELHMTEWNTEERRNTNSFRTGDKAAAHLTASWIAMQEAAIDAAFFYRGTDTNINQPQFYGMFYADGREKPAAKAFKLWGEFSACSRKRAVKTGIRLLDDAPQIDGELKPLWILAGEESPKKLFLLLSNIGSKEIHYTLQLPGPSRSIWVTEIGPPNDTKTSYTADTPTLLIKSLAIQLVKIELE
ncbi:MAG TPA: hypothetical protein PLF03_07370 [Candidatus Omnitrophota bacterium]|nr:hypothetical protein [Candidatus Omnitrophota bacterium]